MALSEKQLQILRFRFSEYSYLICDGAVRSGKTSLMMIGFVDDAMARFNGRRFGICGKTVDSATKNIVQPYMAMQYAQKSYSIKWSRTDKTITVSKGNVTNVFEVFGGKDESSYALIQGRTLAGCLIDEVVLQPRSFVDQAMIRCSVTGSKVWFSCNPAAPSHWFYTDWICKADKGEINAQHIHFVLRDNPGLSEETIRRYEKSFSGVFYQRYVLGLWTVAEGLVYDMFDRQKHIIDKLPELSPKGAYVACDFGTQNATVFLLFQMQSDTGTWIATREYYYSGREQKRQKTVGEYVADLKRWLNGTKPEKVIVDPSALPLITELKQNGVPIQAANNDVLSGILDVQTMLQTGRLKIYRECKRTIQEFGVYAWDPDREDVVIKENDHCMDSIRYFVRTKRLAKRAGG